MKGKIMMYTARDDWGDDEGARASEEWRYDPDRRRAAAELHAEWQAAIDAAEPHLRAALAAFSGLRDREEFTLEQRVAEAAWMAVRAVERVHREPANDTLIGNLAAFGVGWRGAE